MRAGLLIGPFSGRLAASIGYATMLRVGLGGTIIGLIALSLSVDTDSRLLLLRCRFRLLVVCTAIFQKTIVDIFPVFKLMKRISTSPRL